MFIEMRRSWLLAMLLGASGACASNADVPLIDPVDSGVDPSATDDAGLAPPSFPDAAVRSLDVPPPTCAATGAENSDSTCADGVDNDCNGLIDCLDPSCHGTAACAATLDGGAFDVAAPRDGSVRRDSGARRDVGPCTASGMENTNAACSDGVDNDCDGYVDCNDYNCSRTAAVTVCRDAGP